MKKFMLAVIAALSAAGATAATVTTNTVAPTYDGLLNAPSAVSGAVRVNLRDNDLNGVAPEARSPWEGLSNQATAFYNSVQANSSAFYDFSAPRTSFSVMWGSPDRYNTLIFSRNNAEVFRLRGNDLGATLGSGFVNVFVSDLEFDRVEFRNGRLDAFEYANVAPVPLPAAGWMLLAGLGGLGALSRRRKA